MGSFKGDIRLDGPKPYMIGLIKGDTRSSDYSSWGFTAESGCGRFGRAGLGYF